MTQFDTEHGARAASTDDGIAQLLRRNALPLKVAAFYVVALAAGVLARRVVDGPNAEVLLSIAVWFTVIFAACSALLGAVVKLFGVVQRRRHDYE